MENSSPLTPFNYFDWRGAMQMALYNKGLYRMTMGREAEPQQYVEKSKFLNRLDESFGFMCIHISRDLLFHLEGLITPKESWEKFESVFGKQDELRGHITENDPMHTIPTTSRHFNSSS